MLERFPIPESHTLHSESPRGELSPELRARIAEMIGVTDERMDRLRMIAQVVGGDFGMRVELGMPGKGSFFSPEENRIQFDPLHLADSSRELQAEFVAAHEGGHRAITRGPKEIGLKIEKAHELYRQVGFAFGSNECEDPADNDWWRRKYEGLGETIGSTYDAMFDHDAAILGSPEIHQIIAERGSAPRFAHFGSEIIRLWHTGAYSATGLPEDVRQALERVREVAQAYVGDLPSDHPVESEVVERAQSRFRTFHDRIWPEMQRLVTEDMKDEQLRQMLEERAESGGGATSQPGEETGDGGESSPLDGLSDELRKELERAMREAAERAASGAEALGEATAKRAENDAASMREAIEKLQQVAGDESKTEAEREEARQGLAAMEEAVTSLGQQAKEARATGAAQAARLRAGEAPQPIALDELSDDLRRALEEAYAKLPADIRAKIEEQARRRLEDMEDALNADLEGKLTKDDDKPESHADRHEREEHEAAEHTRAEREARERAAAEREISRALEQQRTPYDREYEKVAPLVDHLTESLERLFQKERHPRWRSGFPDGGRLDVRKMMQFEADPSKYTELWERKTIPEKHDRTFTLLVDLSGSMRGEKIIETFKAAIVIAESLGRIGIATEILGFQDELIVFKAEDEPMSDAVRSRMSGMLAEVTNGNPGGLNHADYNDDGYCLDRAVQRLRERTAKEKFLIALSDGEPAPSPAHSGAKWKLASVIKRIRAEGTVKLVGGGIGPGTEHVRTYYPNSVVESVVTKFPEALAVLFEDMIANPEHY